MSLQNVLHEFIEAATDETRSDLLFPLSNLSIYRNNLFTSLFTALQSIYPLTQKLVGEAFFQQIAKEYIKQYPSTSPCLHQYGAYFSEFISNTDWISDYFYLIEFSQFEWDCHQLSREVIKPFTLTINDLSESADFNHFHFKLSASCKVGVYHIPLLKILALCNGESSEMINLDEETERYFILSKTFPSSRDLGQTADVVIKEINLSDYTFLSQIANGYSIFQAYEAALNIDAFYPLQDKLIAYANEAIITDGEFNEP